MLNSLWFEIQGQKITKISFCPIAGGTSINVIELAHLLEDNQVQLGTDWLAISPKGYKADIPTNSNDWFDPEEGG